MMMSGSVGFKETLEKIQSEHLKWTNHNFPGQIPEHPMLGIVEEYGEYFDAVKAANKEGCIDALCDMAIFTVGVANHFKVDAGKEFFKAADGATSMRSIQSRIGKLSHAVLKSRQNIRNNENHKFAIELNIGLILEWIFGQMKTLWLDPRKTLERVWSEVKARDWTKEGEHCPYCDTPLIINEYDGWRWVCFNCSYVSRPATDEEIERQEAEFAAAITDVNVEV